MPLDYIPAPSHNSAYIAYQEENPVIPDSTYLEGNAELDFDKMFNAKAVWGPISGRLIPETKRTLSEIMSRNIANLSREDYEQLRYLIEYIATHPESKQRVFELTGFNDNDLAFAEKYFRKYNSRKMFSKLVEFALKTSSNGKVSKQIGGLVQFIFETGQINGQNIADEYKFQLLRGFPELLSPIWEQAAAECPTQTRICQGENKTFLDLNADNKTDDSDFQTAFSSLEWLSSQIR